MKITAITCITKEAPVKDVKALGKDEAFVYIEAQSMKEAAALLMDTEEAAQEACKNYEEIPENKKPDTMINAYIKEVSTSQKLERYEKTEKIKRFMKTLDLSMEFTRKKDKSGMFELDHIVYLDALARDNSEYEAILKTYAYGYRKGYKAAEKKNKDK